MNNEEKILEMLGQISGQVSTMQGQINTMQGQINTMQGQINTMQGQINTMQGQINRLETNQAALEGRLGRVEAGVAELKDEVRSVKVQLDVDIKTHLNLLSDGHSRLVERLDTLDAVRDLAEETRDSVDVIKVVVKQHSGDITALKKAQ